MLFAISIISSLQAQKYGNFTDGSDTSEIHLHFYKYFYKLSEKLPTIDMMIILH